MAKGDQVAEISLLRPFWGPRLGPKALLRVIGSELISCYIRRVKSASSDRVRHLLKYGQIQPKTGITQRRLAKLEEPWQQPSK
jgi:hypothetical protein